MLWGAAGTQGNIEQLERRIRLDPGEVDLLLQLGLEYAVNDEHAKAIETYFAVLKVDPNNFHAFNNLGILYKKTGRLQDSIFCYQQAQKINPSSYWVPYNLGLAYETLGNLEEAREQYGRALSLNPDFTQALDRLRTLASAAPSAGREQASVKPGIFIVDSADGLPRKVVDQDGTPDAASRQNRVIHRLPSTTTTEVASAAARRIATKNVAAISKPSGSVSGYRTSKTGAAASLFNQAMESMEKGSMEKAVELYIRSIIADRELLSEPDNNLIAKAQSFLQDRPNRMSHGLFYRGFLTSISQGTEKALRDLRNYIGQTRPEDKDSVFLSEAEGIIRYHELVLAEHAAEEAKKEEEQARLAAAAEERTLAVRSSAAASGTLTMEDIKELEPDKIVDEASRMLRQGQIDEALVILRSALLQEPENVKLLMATANAYIDMLLAKGDPAAAKSAKDIFEKIMTIVPNDSKEFQIAESMIKEISKRNQ